MIRMCSRTIQYTKMLEFPNISHQKGFCISDSLTENFCALADLGDSIQEGLYENHRVADGVDTDFLAEHLLVVFFGFVAGFFVDVIEGWDRGGAHERIDMSVGFKLVLIIHKEWILNGTCNDDTAW